CRGSRQDSLVKAKRSPETLASSVHMRSRTLPGGSQRSQKSLRLQRGGSSAGFQLLCPSASQISGTPVNACQKEPASSTLSMPSIRPAAQSQPLRVPLILGGSLSGTT